ncbi:MAG: TldD/PmbA family protein [bacterium]|nr:TldD/PmbA family protein [bacterium]
MWDLLETIMSYAKGWTEIRYHNKLINSVTIRKGELEQSNSIQQKGVGIRVIINGTLGFSSTSRVEKEVLIHVLTEANTAAISASNAKQKKIEGLQIGKLARGEFSPEIHDAVTSYSIEEKISLVRKIEEWVRKASPLIQSAICSYLESLDEKYILTSDGAKVHILDSKPEFRVTAVGFKKGEMQTGTKSIGVTGGWADLFKEKTAEELADEAAKLAVDLLSAPYPEGGRAWVILSPELVGLLAHEAIGHTVEADFVLSGSIAKGKIGHPVASELITLVDSGNPQIKPNAAGIVLVDDEGVQTEQTVVIDHGILRSYLHNRETAKLFGVQPTGNARAWSYSDEPIIRMRNTYIEPGELELDELISEVNDGYFLKGAGGGQADSNAEFMFGVAEPYRIKNGKICELVRGVTISGQAFNVLKSCNGIGREFKWGLGTGYCGKGQMAKVDAGGPYLRCQAIIGGKQK